MSEKKHANKKVLFSVALVALLLSSSLGALMGPSHVRLLFPQLGAPASSPLALSVGLSMNQLASSPKLLLAAAAPQPTDLGAFFKSYLVSWYGIAALLVLLVILVSAMVYMLSSLINSEHSKVWARMQIYEALLGLLLFAVFFSFYSLMLTNPQQAFSSAHLIPSTCTGTDVNTIFTLATCDLGSFLSISFGFFQLIYYASYIGGLAPGVKIGIQLPWYAVGLGAQTGIGSIFPKSGEDFLSMGMDLLVVMLMLNQIQMILIAGAPLFLALFISIGIVSWVLGFSRRFGGAMIAFGLGLGIVYPLLIAITYGFVTNSMMSYFGSLYSAGQGGGQYSAPQSISSAALMVPNFLLKFLQSLFTVAFFGDFSGSVSTFFMEYGYIFAGLTFIPMLNIMILDAFIVDFSKAMGERISFLDLIGQFI